MKKIENSYVEKEVRKCVAYQLNRYDTDKKNHVSPERIDMQLDLENVGIDSISLIDLALNLEEKFRRDDIYKEMFERNNFTGQGLVEIISS